MASNIERLQKRLVEAVKRSEQNIKSLQTSYEIILEEILDFRRQINDSLDRLQQKTVNELDKLHSSLKNYLEDERKQCETFISKLKVHDAKSTKSPDKSFILCRKYLDQIASAELCLQTSPDWQTLNFSTTMTWSSFSLLAKISGKSQVALLWCHINKSIQTKSLTFKERSQFKVRTNTDMTNCKITGICGDTQWQYHHFWLLQ